MKYKAGVIHCSRRWKARPSVVHVPAERTTSWPGLGFKDDIECVKQLGIVALLGSSFFDYSEAGANWMIRFCFPKKFEMLQEARDAVVEDISGISANSTSLAVGRQPEENLCSML